MKVLYISKAFEGNIGAETHYTVIKELFSEENVFTIDLRPQKAFVGERYIAYGKYTSSISRMIRWLQGNMMFISNKIIKDIIGIIKEEKIDIVYVEDSVFGNLIKKIKRYFPKIKTVSFYHDIKANLYSQWNNNVNSVNKIEYTIGIKQEKINSEYCDINIVFNKRDAEMYEEYYGKKPEAILPLSCAEPVFENDYFDKTNSGNGIKTFLFVGKKYYPNLVGIKWLTDNVVEHLNQNVRIQIVGRGLEYLKKELKDPHIEVIGGVDDLGEYYKNTDVVIAPLFDGGGMKSKTLEAFSYGKMFLGTKESLYGFWEETPEYLRNHVVFKKETAQEWIDTMNHIADVNNDKAYKDVYDLFLDKYSFNSLKNNMRKILIGE